MSVILNQMIKIYGISEYDWMNFKITKDNPLTFHHIVKKEAGGDKSIDNGALLTRLAHKYIHQIEHDDIKMFYRLNECLQKINDSKESPTEEMISYINYLLEQYEDKHKPSLTRRIRNTRYNPEAFRKVAYIKDLLMPTTFRLVMQQGIDLTKGDYVTKMYKKKKR